MTTFDDKLKNLAVDLFNIGVLKFGDFKMKVGINSPVYCDLRLIVSYPQIMTCLTNLLCEYSKQLSFDQLCGVPYTALPIATIMSSKLNIPMLIRRKEQKAYGTKKLIEGKFEQNEICLIIEDVVTSGSSILETVIDLKNEGLDVRETLVVLNREQGGCDNLCEKGIRMHSLFTMTSLMKILQEAGSISQNIADDVQKYIQNSQIYSSGKMKNGSKEMDTKDRLALTFQERINLAQNPVAKVLFNIMHTKKSILCVAADVTDTKSLLDIAETVGPHICLLKTHIDIIDDYMPDLSTKLMSIAKKHNFLIMEDRKFSDIGNTVKMQYAHGIYKISSWADLVTIHGIPGPCILRAIQSAETSVLKGVFLIAEMSCEGNLITRSVSNEVMRLVETDQKLVAGIVCQSKNLVKDPGLIQLTPGVKFSTTGDKLGQQYNSPEKVILEGGADIAVVGRGIVEADDSAKTAEQYKIALWEAYLKRLHLSCD